jgi:DNA-binding transcriptional LysR family regulator
MAELADYRTFLAIVERGSLTGAARHLGRSLQSVSRSLQMLEEQLGVELVARTTRRSRPTPAGQAFYGRLKEALADIALARDSVMQEGADISGRIRVGASSRFGVAYVLPILSAFMERHPKVKIDLSLDDAYVDLMEDNLDLSVQVGRLPDSSLRIRRLGAIRRVIFASPRYLAAQGGR